ncbi:MAG: hypothetical protein CMH68_03810 [Nisaea sp.]|nr:hypothetical protein [Nisaea sp.]
MVRAIAGGKLGGVRTVIKLTGPLGAEAPAISPSATKVSAATTPQCRQKRGACLTVGVARFMLSARRSAGA